MNLKNKNFFRGICLFNICIILLLLLIITQIQSSLGYEISIYNTYPWYFWLLIEIPIISLFFAPIFKIVYSASQKLNSYLIISAILSLSIFYLLPYFRGYALFGNGDTLSHIGYMKTILSTGSIHDNIYPITHIWIFCLSSITKFEPKMISFFMPFLFILIYIVGMFLLSKSLNYNSQTSLLITLFAFIPIFGTEVLRESIMPSVDAFSMIPLTLFLLFKTELKSSSSMYSILLVIMLLLFPFFHPEVTVFLLIILITIYITQKPFSLKTKYKGTSIILLIVAFLAWFSSTIVFGTTINEIYTSLISNVVQGPLTSRTVFQPTTLTDRLDFIFRTYGAILIYLAISASVSISNIRKVILKKEEFNYDFMFSSLFIVLCITSFIFLLKGMIIGYNMFRLLKYPLMVSTILLGSYFARKIFPENEYDILRITGTKNESTHSTFMLSKIERKSLSKIMIHLLFVLVIMSSTTISIFNTYPSEKIFGFNYQTTDFDFSGMDFLITYRNEDLFIVETLSRSYQSRFSDYFLGVGTARKSIRSGYESYILPPPHFGYDLKNNIGRFYSNNQYMLLYALSEKYYPGVYPNRNNLWRYTPDDFQKLRTDSTVQLVYNNGEFRLLIINGVNK